MKTPSTLLAAVTLSTAVTCAGVERGIEPSLTLTGEAWRNIDGGVETGSEWNYLLDLSVTLDLAELCGGPEGGSGVIHSLNGTNRGTHCFGDFTGAFNPSSNIHAEDHVRFYNLFYQQSWNDDALVMKLGQQAADDDFMGSDYSGLFMNSAFGAMPSQVATALAENRCGTSAFPIFAVAAPGAFISFRPNDEFFLQTGAYVGSPGEDVRGNHGFDWKINSDAGAACFYEGGWHYQWSCLPGTLKLGGTLHTGLFEDLETRNDGSVDATTRGIYSFYFIADQALLADDKGEPVVGAFWRCGISPQEDRSVVSSYNDLGVAWNGPFGRADDQCGLAISHTRFGSEFLAQDWAENLPSGETVIEVTYRAQITTWLALQGDVQWLLNPAFSETSGGSDHATVVGLRAELTF